MSECESYPDIWIDESKVPEGPERDRAKKQNAVSAKLYRGVRFVLEKNFGLEGRVPKEPRDFGKTPMKDDERAQFLAITGMMLADNLSDPSLGKTTKGDEDELIFEDHPGTKNDITIIVAKRFIDGVVGAVQEYTRNAELYTKTFVFMKKHGSTIPPAETTESRA